MVFDAEKSFREWMRNICKAQNMEGALPGIVPQRVGALPGGMVQPGIKFYSKYRILIINIMAIKKLFERVLLQCSDI